MLSVLEILQRTTDFLAGKGVENPRLNAELLVGHALSLKRMQLYLQFERLLTESELEKIRPLVRRRSLREPLQYILGETEWHGLKLKVDRRALIPRPETELLLENVIQAVTAAPPARILDLGTGSGALALGLAVAFPQASILAVDRSVEALALARENAASLQLMPERVEFCESDWWSAIAAGEVFSLIVANPPYLSEAETAATAPEVREHEPKSALTAGDGGLGDLKIIFSRAQEFLGSGGLVAAETGIDQHAQLLQIARDSGFTQLESKKDLAGRDRFILARR